MGRSVIAAIDGTPPSSAIMSRPAAGWPPHTPTFRIRTRQVGEAFPAVPGPVRVSFPHRPTVRGCRKPMSCAPLVVAWPFQAGQTSGLCR